MFGLNKDEISEKLNELLGTSDDPIDFTKLSKKDLERLLQIFSNIVQVAQVGVRSLRSRVQEGGFLFKSVQEVANMRVIDVIQNIRREGGLLGLVEGILRERTATARERKG